MRKNPQKREEIGYYVKIVFEELKFLLCVTPIDPEAIKEAQSRTGQNSAGANQIDKIKGQLNCIAALMQLQVREKVKLSLEKMVRFFQNFNNPTKMLNAAEYDLENYTEAPALEIRLIPGDQSLPLFNPSIEMIKVDNCIPILGP